MASSPCLDIGVLGGACLCGTVAFWPRIKQIVLKKISALASQVLSAVDVSLRDLDITISRAGLLQVVVRGLTIGNVEGYKSPHLAKIETVTVVVDALKAAKSALGSCGKPSEVDIVSVQASECNFSLEKDSVTSSNFKKFLDNLGKQEEAAEAAEKAEAEEANEDQDEAEAEKKKGAVEAVTAVVAGTGKAAATLVTGTAKAVGGTAKAAAKLASKARFKKRKKDKGMKVAIHRVEITGMSVEMFLPGVTAEGKKGQTVKFPDLKIHDFAKEFGRVTPKRAVRKLIMAVFKSLLGVTSKLASAGGQALKGAEQAAEGTWGYISGLFS